MDQRFVSALIFCAASSVALAQVVLPEGTKVRVRLEQALSSATAEEGQPVQLSVTEDVKVGETVAVSQGASCVGTITQALPKRRMGRTGKLDFSIERCSAIDGNAVPLRYTVNKKEGGSHAGRTGALTAGAAIIFWPAAPVFLLMKGKDVTVNKGVVVDVFTDQRYIVKETARVEPPAAGAASAAPAPGAVAVPAPGAPAGPGPAQTATVRITSEPEGAEIELNGAFIGSTPATLQLPAGQQNLTLRKGALLWRRAIQIQPGSNVNINAELSRQ